MGTEIWKEWGNGTLVPNNKDGGGGIAILNKKRTHKINLENHKISGELQIFGNSNKENGNQKVEIQTTLGKVRRA